MKKVPLFIFATVITSAGIYTVDDSSTNLAAAIAETDSVELGDVTALGQQLATAQATLTAAQAQDASDEAALATAQAAIAQAITDLGGTPPAEATASN